MLWVLKEPSQCDGSFEHPKHMLRSMGKKNFVYLNLCMINLCCFSVIPQAQDHQKLRDPASIRG